MSELKYYKIQLGVPPHGTVGVRNSEEDHGQLPMTWSEVECTKEEYLTIKEFFDAHREELKKTMNPNNPFHKHYFE